MKERILLFLSIIGVAAISLLWSYPIEWTAQLPRDTWTPLLGLTSDQWLSLLAIGVVSGILGFTTTWVVRLYIRIRKRSGAVAVTDITLRGIRRSIGCAAAASLAHFALQSVRLPDQWQTIAWRILELSLACSFVWMVYSLWDALCDTIVERSNVNHRAENLLIPIARKLVRFAIVVGGALMGLAWMGVNVVGALAGLGIGGLAVALAAKDSLENLFGSLTLLFDMPFAIGDWVKIGATEGAVEEINLRSTRIRTAEDSVVTLPNSNMINASVENFGARRFRRFRTFITVSWKTPSESIEQFCSSLKAQIAKRSEIRSDGLVVAPFESKDLGLSIMLQCLVECQTFEEETAVKAEILKDASALADKHGLVWPRTE
jgi:MscS family membrane protein